MKNQKSFTLIELLLVVAIIAVLATAIIFAIKPRERLAQARDATRDRHLHAYRTALSAYDTDHEGFTGLNIPNTLTEICNTNVVTSTDCGNLVDLSPLVPQYLPSMPVDPKGGVSATGTGYAVALTDGEILLVALQSETRPVIAGPFWSYWRPITIDNKTNTTLTDYQILVTNPVWNETGLVGSWHFDEGSGNIASDSSGMVNNGTIYGATWVDGRFGKALNFNGASSYVESPDTPSLHSDRAITIVGWFITNAFDKTWQSIYWKGNTPDCTTGCENREYALWLHSTGFLHLTSTPVDRVGVGQHACNTPSGTITTGKWYFFATVISSDGNFMRTYVNGELKANCRYSTAGIRDTTGPLRIGNNPSWNSHFNGIIDEVRIYNRALSDDEIKALYEAKAKLNYDDIAFADSDKVTFLNYWKEADGKFWVKVPSIPPGKKTIYVYYGNLRATSRSNGDNTFDFFDDFSETSLDTTKWVAYANNYSVSNSILRVNIGGIERTSAFPFNIQDGYIAETKVIHYALASNYGGVLPEVASSPYTAGGNANADATILYMRESGSATVYYWIGDGSSASYNVGVGSTGWTSSDNTWYITGVSVRGGEVKLWRDGTAIFTVTGITWYKNLKYVKLGSFQRANTYDIQDTGYDWIRVRKYTSPEPTISLGSEQGI
jgi:prepilin-type N-terminal cleavage/methylation domain-containing protein